MKCGNHWAVKTFVKSFPEFVKKLPKADYSSGSAGAIRGFVVQSKNHQVVFNENDQAAEFTPHTHPASFGVVLEGECELVIEGKSKFIAPVMFITFRKEPCILPGSLQITKTL